MYTTNTALHFMIWPCHSKMVRNSQLAKVTICAESAGSKKGNCLSAMDVLRFIKLAMQPKTSWIMLYCCAVMHAWDLNVSTEDDWRCPSCSGAYSVIGDSSTSTKRQLIIRLTSVVEPTETETSGCSAEFPSISVVEAMNMQLAEKGLHGMAENNVQWLLISGKHHEILQPYSHKLWL
ncbi:hypothetical protein Droror1_Dr00009186 [Drosera rotundifolia]